MKLRMIILSLIALLFSNEIFAQDPVNPTKQFYRISLKINGKKKNKSLGFLAWMTDSTLYYSKNKLEYSSVGLNEYILDTISYKEIRSVSLYTGNPTAMILLPAAAGFLTGAVLGFAQGDDDPGQLFSMTASEKGLVLGVVGFAAGAMIGGFITLGIHHNFKIRASRDKFLELLKFINSKEFHAS